ncbi:hypothetical protein LTR28_006159 [Elasticomyces elasticus]|nr:hypothetical protein LTR28_006159 [Elasticomyces elasticus]
MSRAITVTEQINIHLVWTKGKIFIKPLLRYLLDKSCGKTHFDGKSELANVIKEPYVHEELGLNRLDTIYRWLRGDLLYSYSHETSLSLRSDFFTDNFGKLAAVLVQ